MRRVESAPCRGGRSCGLQAPRPWVTLLRVGTRGRQRPRAHQRSWHHRGSLGAAARDGCARSAPFARVGAREALRAEDAGRPGSGAWIRSPYVSEDRRGRYIIPLGQERPKGPIGRQRGVRALPARKPQVVTSCTYHLKSSLYLTCGDILLLHERWLRRVAAHVVAAQDTVRRGHGHLLPLLLDDLDWRR